MPHVGALPPFPRPARLLFSSWDSTAGPPVLVSPAPEVQAFVSASFLCVVQVGCILLFWLQFTDYFSALFILFESVRSVLFSVTAFFSSDLPFGSSLYLPFLD